MITDRPVEVLFSAYRRKVLALLLVRPEERYHVREISRLTGVPAGSLHRELKLLAAAGLLSRETVGRQVYYQADRQSPIYPELAAIFRKTAGMADVIREALLPLGPLIELAFIFGSAAAGRERSGSDIDLFVIGGVSFTEVVGALADIHESLGREINPVLMDRKTFSERSDSDPFIKRVIKEPKIFVIGTGNDLSDLA
ncbi:MAG: nucleotidyltransferase domain-containing protein [Desulfurivibrionaceae bacterium]|nr:nucleotidyltransferase domain-containing protein [Desulfobulbales bacterium]MDT8334473.1 nucleotidyltransferase domain-containing protein [Desulfurivibrionaceae bacterium]